MNGKYTVGRIPKHEEPDTVLIGCDASIFARVVGRPGHPAEPLALTMVEALNVVAETGRTPAQLAEERAELVGALEGLLCTGMNGGNNVRLALIAAKQDALSDDELRNAELSEAAVCRARTILDKVKK